MSAITQLILYIVAFLVSGGILIGLFLYFNPKVKVQKGLSDEEIEELIRAKAHGKIQKAEKEAEEIRTEAESRITKLKKDLVEQERLLAERESTLTERSRMLDRQSAEIDVSKESIKATEKDLEESKAKLATALEKISGLTREEATKKLKEEIEEEMSHYKAGLIRQSEKLAQEAAEEKAKNTIVEAMQRIVTDYVGETTTSTVKLEDEKVKGRVIGKEGRNIRAFEIATGVDVIVDESPTSIGLSSFDPLRREIARVAMENLIKDGRIHPGSIEDVIRKAKNEIANEIKNNGQLLADEANWPSIDVGLLKLIGKMKYRTSYGQTLMKHTIEVIRLGAVIAAEIHADVDLVKKACLLHDVGKVLTHKVEGAHHHISGQIARKYNLPDKLVNAIEAHHLDIEPQSPEAVVVYLADAISGARPGARKDSYEQYIKRVESLENIAKEVGGTKIKEVYAIHAGRELRVIVLPNKTTDDEMNVLAKDIADKVKETQTYPGTVLINVIRESRAQAEAL